MKNILLVLGLLASTSLTFVEAPAAQANSCQRLSAQLTREHFTTVNYSATDEDGNRENVDTESKKTN